MRLFNSSVHTYIIATIIVAAILLPFRRTQNGSDAFAATLSNSISPGGTYVYYVPSYKADADAYYSAVHLRNGSATTAATVTVAAYQNDGTEVSLGASFANFPINPSGQWAAVLPQTDALGNPIEGWIKVYSTHPLIGFAWVGKLDGRWPRMMADVSLIDELHATLVVPHVAQTIEGFYAGGGWSTRVNVCNPHVSLTNVTTRFYSEAGENLYSSPIISIPANGSVSYNLEDCIPAGQSFTRGSVVITATQPVAASALYYDGQKAPGGEGTCWAGISAVALPEESTDGGAIIVDHRCTDITDIPESVITQAKERLHIAYGHTSHGSQVTNGMTGLVAFADGGGKGLSLPEDIFAWNNGGAGGALDLHDYAMGDDVGYYPQWVNCTRDYLDDPSHADVNVIIWSWCGQVDERYADGVLDDEYLDPMNQLETEYPGVTFVYMTGHVDHFDDANNKAANQMIRDYCQTNDKVLYDFADIESYDPDGTFYEFPHDNCDYYASAFGAKLGNWATAWQDSHTEDVDWYDCGSSHSLPLNANQKAYAAWWLWARLGGWAGPGSAAQAGASPAAVE